MLSPKFLKRAYDRLLRQDAIDRDPPSPQAEKMADEIQRAKAVDTDLKNQVPPGTVYACTEPEFIGALPVGLEYNMYTRPPELDLLLVEPPQGPSLAEIEFKEHGSIALRIPASIAGEPWDNTIDRTWTLTPGGTVLVRGQAGGFYMVDLKGDVEDWHVVCDKKRVPVVFCEVRDRWVVKELV